MEEKVSGVSYDKESNIIKFKILKVDNEINLKELEVKFGGTLVLDEKNIPKYIYGGGNIIFYIGKKYILRYSISKKFKIEDYRKEITKYYDLSKLKIGVEIYYPLENN